MAELNVVREASSLSDADFKSAATSGGDTCQNRPGTVLYIKNESGAQRVVTIAAPGQCSHGFLHPLVITISASTTLYKTRTFPQTRFGGLLAITYDNPASLQLVGVFQEDYFA